MNKSVCYDGRPAVPQNYPTEVATTAIAVGLTTLLGLGVLTVVQRVVDSESQAPLYGSSQTMSVAGRTFIILIYILLVIYVINKATGHNIPPSPAIVFFICLLALWIVPLASNSADRVLVVTIIGAVFTYYCMRYLLGKYTFTHISLFSFALGGSVTMSFLLLCQGVGLIKGDITDLIAVLLGPALAVVISTIVLSVESRPGAWFGHNVDDLKPSRDYSLSPSDRQDRRKAAKRAADSHLVQQAVGLDEVAVIE